MRAEVIDTTHTGMLHDIAALSPERRELLDVLLDEQGIDIAELPILPQSRAAHVFPLSLGQQRLWFVSQSQPSSAYYNEPIAVQLCGQLKLAALEQSLSQLI